MRRYTLLYILFIWISISAYGQNDSITVDSIAIDSVVIDSIPVDPLVITDIPVQQRIDTLLAGDLFKTSQVGIMVYDLTADSLIYAHNERQLMRPASTNKLLTAITALDKLGGSYRYSTSMRLKGEPHGNTFVGDVIIKGGMDPRFNSDDMNAFIETLQKAKIDTIYGNIQADLSFKDNKLLGEGWCWDDGDDNPVLTPLLWNRRDQFMPKFQQCIRKAGIVVRSKSDIPKDSLGNMILPPLSIKKVKGDTIVVRHHTIDQILVRMMKDSDNLYAESMFYQLGPSAKDAIVVIKKLIEKIGLNPSDYRFADGSGLSLYNYQTAEMQTKTLRYAYKNSNIYTHLYPSLPIAGVDGTLKSRMRRTKAAENVHAKTGTLSGISSLSGYLTASNGNTLCFVIINQGVLRSAPAKKFQDCVCNILCTYK